jgi:hypothetical protein
VYKIAGRPVTVILGPRHPPEALMDAIALAPEGILEENLGAHSAIFSTAHGILFGAVGEMSFADLQGLLAPSARTRGLLLRLFSRTPLPAPKTPEDKEGP